MAAFNKGSGPWAGYCASGCHSLQLYYNLTHHATLFAEGDGGILILDKYNGLSLHTSKVALQARTYSGFRSMKQLEIFLLPPGWDAIPWQGYPQH